MITLKKPATAVLCAAFLLGACTDPAQLTADGPASKTKQGALFGGILIFLLQAAFFTAMGLVIFLETQTTS